MRIIKLYMDKVNFKKKIIVALELSCMAIDPVHFLFSCV